MPISAYLMNKWDARLYNWLLWLGTAGHGSSSFAKISSIYRPELWQRGYGTPGNAVLSGEAMDTDRLMVRIQADDDRVYSALLSWAINEGTRGAQAQKLSMHQDTYRDLVDSGVRMLDRMARK